MVRQSLELNSDIPLRSTPSKRVESSVFWIPLPTNAYTRFIDALPEDPRVLQLCALITLFSYGLITKVFSFEPLKIIAVFSAAFATQFIGSLINAIRMDTRSAAVTSLSLLLLLRADNPMIMALAASIAIGSKFLIRLYGKHIFNPANIGIVTLLIVSSLMPVGSSLSGAAWTTPGQWGTAIWLAALLAGIGFIITSRAARLDIPLTFLAVFAGLAFARAAWLGDPISIPIHRLQNSALMLFAFFMIADPKTTPDTPLGRILFAGLTATLAHWLIFQNFISDGIFYALAIMCIIRPVLDAIALAPAYTWPKHHNQNPACRDAAQQNSPFKSNSHFKRKERH
ncbi:MAG: RnfABCDGE type electron transport complex subunit D [Pseudomonadota bacterium]